MDLFLYGCRNFLQPINVVKFEIVIKEVSLVAIKSNDRVVEKGTLFLGVLHVLLQIVLWVLKENIKFIQKGEKIFKRNTYLKFFI